MFHIEYRLKAVYGAKPNETVVLSDVSRYWFDVRAFHGYAPYEGVSIDLVISLAKDGEDGLRGKVISVTDIEYLLIRDIRNTPKAD